MTLVISDDGSIVSNSATIEDVPAVRITGNGVQFTNESGGILRATAYGTPAILVTGVGSHIINQAGARIESWNSYLSAVQGGVGADRFDNYGVILGEVTLGDGADVYNEYFSSGTQPTPNVDLGAGSDTYNLLIGDGPVLWGTVWGGSGEDYLNINGDISIVRGFLEFEHVTVGPNVDNLQGFNGLLSLTLTPGGFNSFSYSSNSSLDVALDRNWFSIGPFSSFRNITGGDGRETLGLSTSIFGVSTLTGSANLGGGDDTVFLSLFDTSAVNPDITGTVNGGSGLDNVFITSRSTEAVDLADFVNFEVLSVGTQSLPGTATARVVNANGFLEINTADDVSIGLSNSPNAQFWGAFRGTTTLESTTTVGFVRYKYAPANVTEIQISDVQYDMILVNNGVILGAVELFTGNDVYDGTLGTTGGTVFGYAGNDHITGGAGAERIEGGYGDDVITGNGGADQLFGDDGNDTASYQRSNAGVTINLSTGSASGGHATGDTLFSFENIIGSDHPDFLTGDAGNNILTGGPNGDTLVGGGGDDQLYGGPGNNILHGGDGNDLIGLSWGASGDSADGGAGYDILRVVGPLGLPNPPLLPSLSHVASLAGIEAVEFAEGFSTLQLTGAQFTNGLALDTNVSGTGTLLVMLNAPGTFVSKFFTFASSVSLVVNGTAGIDIFKLGSAANTVNAGDGLDQVKGGNLVDTISGGNGDDKINGAGGADILTGGAGNDVFKYAAAIDSGLGTAADRITDFVIGGDRLNFAQIDANAGTGGDQAFTFVGSGAFAGGGAGSIRYQNSGADLLVQSDVNGDGIADMEIILQGLAGGTLTSGDFVL